MDIGKIVSTWTKALRMEYAGRVERYSNEMPLQEAMARTFNELKNRSDRENEQ